MAKTDTARAQYVVNFAYRYQYMMRVNLRELCHLVELRTLPQGHQDYRDAAHRMYKQVCDIHPVLSRIIKFADTGIYRMGRIGPESAQYQKCLNLVDRLARQDRAPKKKRICSARGERAVPSGEPVHVAGQHCSTNWTCIKIC